MSKTGMDFIREYAANSSQYLPLHSDWKGRNQEKGIAPEDQDTDYGWSAGAIGNRPWFAECWGRWGVEMLTVYLSSEGIEDLTADDLDRMMEENGIWRAVSNEKYGPSLEKVTDRDSKEYYSISRTVRSGDKEKDRCMESMTPLYSWEELTAYQDILEEKENRSRDAISNLCEEKYVDFFTDPSSEFVVEAEKAYAFYPEIMEKFYRRVRKAFMAVNKGPVIKGPSIWTKMKEKYFGNTSVFPEEMIEKLSEFDTREIVAFLYYCVMYKERFCDGAYGYYAKQGIIGKLLTRLNEILNQSNTQEEAENEK